MNEASSRRQALLALGLMSLIWSLNWIVMKRAMQYIGPFDFSALRTAAGTTLLFALLWWRGESLAPPPLRDSILIGVAQTGAFQLLVQLSLVEGGAGKMALLAYTMPFWVIAFAWMLLGERPGPRQWACFGLAGAGLVLVMEPWREIGSLHSCLLALAGGGCWGLATVLTKRLFQRAAITPLRLTAWQALFGTILLYFAAEKVLGAGGGALLWTELDSVKGELEPTVLSLAFVFLLVGYGTKVGLVPLHNWLPDAHAEGPTPVSAVLSGLLLNVALYAVLRCKALVQGAVDTPVAARLMMGFGLLSVVVAAFMLSRQKDIKRMFAYSSIEHMGLVAFAFGWAGRSRPSPGCST